MGKKHSVFLVLLLFSIAIVTTAIQVRKVSAEHPSPYYSVEPNFVSFGPEPSVNETFTVAVKLLNVTSANVPAGVYGVEIQFQWDPTLLELQRVNMKIGVTGGVLNSPYFVAKNESKTTTLPDDTWWISATSLPPAKGWFGDGIVAEFTFKIVKQPNWYEKSKENCGLNLIFTDLVDAYAGIVQHEKENGYYEILATEPSPKPVIKVEPAQVVYGPEYSKNKTFTVEVKLYNIRTSNVPNGTYGVEVKLSWNATLLEYVSHETVLGKPGGVLNEPIFVAYNQTTVENGVGTYWLVATSLSPALYWYGNGTIVKITFKIIYQGFEPQPSVSSSLKLEFTDIVMPHTPTVVSIPHNREDGLYRIESVPKKTFHTVTVNSQNFIVAVECDGAVIAPPNLGLNLNLKQITFNVTYADGYCNVTIPKSLMWCNSLNDWVILVDNAAPSYKWLSENNTHTFLWFNFTSGDHVIVIRSTQIVPEIPSTFMTLILLLASSAVLIIMRKRK